ncbi:MAG TPA: hypothetical protein VEJ63_16170 [Planctomycetota bacterium]|nr:hypothetical protein [Planctomycetota bacterium]
MLRFSAVFALSLCLAAAAEESFDDDRLLKLVGELASDEFNVRQEAEAALSKAPFESFDTLITLYTKSKDAEVRERLRKVLTQVSFRLCETNRGKKVTINADKQPAREVLASVAKQLGYEPGAFDFLRPTLGDRVFTIQVKEMEDRHIMRWMLRLCGIEPRLEWKGEERAYELKDLPLKPEEMHRIIKERWLAAELNDKEGSIALDGTTLKVTVSLDAHRQLGLMLSQLREQKDARIVHVKPEGLPLRDAMLQMMRDKRVSFEFIEKSLEDAVAFIQKETGVPLIIDPRIAAGGGNPEINLRVTDMTADLALEWVLKLADLQLSYQDQAMVITKAQIDPTPREFLIIDATEWTKVPGQNISATNIADMLRNRVRPETWDAALGTFIEESDNKLIIAQIPEVASAVLELLDIFGDYLKMVRKVEPDGKPSATPLKPEDVPFYRKSAIPVVRKGETPEDRDRSWEKDLREKLAKPIALEVQDAELSDVAATISKLAGIDVILDPKIVAEGAHKTPITLRVKHMRADFVLKWVMRLSDLEFDLRSKVVFISKRANLASYVELEIFYVRDLKAVFEATDLQTIIKDKLMPAEFADPCTSIEESNGVLVVMQVPEVQARIQKLLTWLRQHPDEKAMMLHRVAELIDEHPELKKKLEKKISFTFEDTPLASALSTLQDKLDASIVLDPRVAAGNPPPVTLKVTDMPGHEALDWFLRMCETRYKFIDGAIFVSKADTLLNVECGVYSVAGIKGHTLTEVADLIHKKVDPKSWDAGLGASIEERAGKLVIMQTPENHVLIADAMEKLRAQSK